MTFLMPQVRVCGVVVATRHMKRRYDLDWLRVIAFALLMLFHTGMLFSTWTSLLSIVTVSDEAVAPDRVPPSPGGPPPNMLAPLE